jgi:hypothetical protein
MVALSPEARRRALLRSELDRFARVVVVVGYLLAGLAAALFIAVPWTVGVVGIFMALLR